MEIVIDNVKFNLKVYNIFNYVLKLYFLDMFSIELGEFLCLEGFFF